MSAWAFALIVVVVFIGAFMQRVSGMGLGLLGVPVLSLIVGPVAGVLIINVLAMINAIFQSISVRKNIDWRKFWLIGPVMAIGALPGAWVVHNTPPGPLQALVGGLILLGLIVTTYMPNQMRIDGPQYATTAGIVGGFMNTLAGIAGPSITVYAQASRWPQRTFAATLQPLFFVSGALSLIFKELTGSESIFTTTPPLLWPLGVVALLGGIALGTRVSKNIPAQKARSLALLLAGSGAAIILVRGLIEMFV